MEVNKKQLADIFGASIRTIQNWQEQGMPVLRGGGKGNEVLYDSADVIKWYAERDAEIVRWRYLGRYQSASLLPVCPTLYREPLRDRHRNLLARRSHKHQARWPHA